MKILDNIVIFLFIAGFAFAVLGVFDKIENQNRIQRSCNSKCGISRTMVAQDICFCLTPEGWKETK